jgi:hypothetical protein
MARSTFTERMSRLEQQRARIAEEEARIKDQERKRRTRRVIEAGGLVEKAELLDLEANVLLGGLLALKEMSTKPDIMARWAAEGSKVFAAEARAKDTGREPVVIVFAGPIARELTVQLRASGLRWNKVLQHWEGIAEHDVVAPLASAHGGMIRRVRPGIAEPTGVAAE